MYKLYHVERELVLVENLMMATTFICRLRGLMFTSELLPGEGLFLSPCNSVHTFFMRYPLDVLFLDGQMQILQCLSCIQPNRISLLVRGARHAVELPAGKIKQYGISAGDNLLISETHNHPKT